VSLLRTDQINAVFKLNGTHSFDVALRMYRVGEKYGCEALTTESISLINLLSSRIAQRSEGWPNVEPAVREDVSFDIRRFADVVQAPRVWKTAEPDALRSCLGAAAYRMRHVLKHFYEFFIWARLPTKGRKFTQESRWEELRPLVKKYRR